MQFNISGKLYDDNSSVTLIDDVRVSINTTLYHWMLTCETFFAIAIYNECGITRSDEYQLNSMLSKSIVLMLIVRYSHFIVDNVPCLSVSSTYTMMSSLVTATLQLSSTYSVPEGSASLIC